MVYLKVAGMTSGFAHTPVLLAEVVAYLAPRPGGLYCDGTVGGGGHARQILEHSSPDGRVIAVDRDPEALAAARHDLAEFATRVTLVHGTFDQLDAIIAELAPTLGRDRVDGLLLDLGPSSPQFDHPERGFSFMHQGPVDMRMNQQVGESAGQLLRRVSWVELARILHEFGEERYSKRIAQRIKEAVSRDRVANTTDLAALVEEAIPAAARRRMKIHPATRTFQALRIAVNRELDQLTRFLEIFPDLLAPAGRCGVISFHSLEDRLVKRKFRELAWCSSLPPEVARQVGERVDPICSTVTRRPVFASAEEIARNPRARSARLRVCEQVVV